MKFKVISNNKMHSNKEAHAWYEDVVMGSLIDIFRNPFCRLTVNLKACKEDYMSMTYDPEYGHVVCEIEFKDKATNAYVKNYFKEIGLNIA